MGFAIPAQGKAMAGGFSFPHQPMVRVLSFGDSPGKVPTCLLLAHPEGLGGGCILGGGSKFQCLVAQLMRSMSIVLHTG